MSDFGLSSTISTWGNVLTDYYGTKYDKQENELAYQRAIENRDYMNWYNSPAQQMARLKQAGLNPRLMYGQGNTGNQSISPNYNSTQSRTSPKNIQVDPLTAMEMRSKLSQIRYVDSMTEKQRLSNDLFKDTYEVKWENEVRSLDKLRYLNNKYKLEGELTEWIMKVKKNEARLQDFEIWLNSKGMSKKDSLIARGIATYGRNMVDYTKEKYNNLKESFVPLQ